MRYFPLSCLCLLLFCCNKKNEANSNTAAVGVTNVAPGSPDVSVVFDGVSLIPSGSLPYDSSTSVPGNPYPGVAVSGVHFLSVTSTAGDSLASGNIAFQTAVHYSLFVYDTLGISGKLKTILFQDNLTIPADSLCYINFINFAPGTLLRLNMLNITVDSVNSANDTSLLNYQVYVAGSTNPASYRQYLIKGGQFSVAVQDTSLTTIKTFPLNLLGAKSYTLFLQGYNDRQDADSLRLKTILHN